MAQFGYRPAAGQQAAVATAQTGVPPAPTSSTPGTAPPSPPMPGGGGSPPVSSTGHPRCCDTGRPLFTDPLTGQPVCSCQYEMLGYGRPALPALSVYSAAAAYPDGVAAYFPGLGADQSPFYGPAAGLELKENLAAGAGWPYPSVYHPYDAAFAGYPFNGYGMDLNGARRKNATRETTSTLKAWLNEHKKNPYPTKGEKIMLAIITKMTLTQVSTWFANARRRLKKENKMTWEPRNRVEDDDNNNDDDEQDRKSTDGKDLLDSKDSGTASSSEEGEQQRPPPAPHARLESDWPTSVASGAASDSPPPATTRSSPSPPPRVAPKPRIWSLADMASKGGGGSGGDEGGGGGTDGLYASVAARLPSTLSRLPALPYQRPPDFYRALYAHAPSPAELLESYQRRLAAPSAAQAAARASPSSPSSLSSGSEHAGSIQQPLALGKV